MPRGFHYPRVPEDLASCLRCRCVVVVRRRGETSGVIALMNPGPTLRSPIDQALGRNMQGFQMPGGSYHDGRCVAFDWIAKPEDIP